MGELGSTQHVVLLVEPNRSFSTLISSMLTRGGYFVLVANTAEEALALCAEVAGVELLVTDVVLPGASGIDLAHRVSERNPQAKILYLSSVPEEALRKQGIGDLASVLVKPISLSDLMSQVEHLLRSIP